MRTGSRRPTRYVLVPGPVIMPGLSPSPGPPSWDTVAVFGNAGSIQLTPASLSHAEVTVLDVRACTELGRGAAPHDLALLEDVVSVGDPRQRGHVLVDQQDRLPARLEVDQAAPDLRPDERREPLRRLVEDEQARVRHERAPDREHLLLAAREGPAEDALATGELGKEVEDLLDRPRVPVAAAVRRGRDKILAHGEVREDLAALGHEADPRLRDARCAAPGPRPTQDAPLPPPRTPPHRPRGPPLRLAHALPPARPPPLTGVDRAREAEDPRGGAVGRPERADNGKTTRLNSILFV